MLRFKRKKVYFGIEKIVGPFSVLLVGKPNHEIFTLIIGEENEECESGYLCIDFDSGSLEEMLFKFINEINRIENENNR